MGASHPPVPNKPLKKIREGELVKMDDLLPERLGPSGGNEPTKSTKKQRITTNGEDVLACMPPLFLTVPQECQIC